MSSNYSDWLGHQVVLEIDSGESRVPLRGRVVNESTDALRFRLEGRWDVDIFKEMIVRVEPDNFPTPNPSTFHPAPNDQTVGMPRSGSLLLHNWTSALDTVIQNWTCSLDLWWSKHFSKQLCYKTMLSTGLAGSILFLLAMQVGLSQPSGFFVRVICGFLGLVLSAVCLGCAGWLCGESATMQAQIIPYCSRLSESFLRSLHKTSNP